MLSASFTPSSPGHASLFHVLVMGLMYGIVHVIGPDHLATLITLSTATSKTAAFKVGAAWGLGHSFGMVFMATALVAMEKLALVASVSVHLWEYVGNYFIGISMILCAIYFFIKEASFLQQKADGTIVAQPCACHVHDATPEADSRRASSDTQSRGRSKAGLCAAYGHSHEDASSFSERCYPFSSSVDEVCSSGSEEEDYEGQPLLPNSTAKSQCSSGPQDTRARNWCQQLFSGRGIKGAVLGLFQGACCPLGLVGISFLANLNIMGILGFLVVFMCISTFGTATLAVAWAHLTAQGLAGWISPQVAYRVSCSFTLCLGVAWVVANFCGVLGRLDYTEALHSHAKLMQGHTHS